MSTTAVIDFINRSDTDPDLQAKLETTRGIEGVVEIAAESGYDFGADELERVTSLLTFVRDLWTVEELQAAIRSAHDDAEIARIAREHGYTFEEEDLGAVSFSAEGELDEAQLEAVAGGTIADVQRTAGLRVQIGAAIQRETTGADFGTMFESGLSKSADTTLSGAAIAAPYVPGGAVVSAAISSVSSTSTSSDDTSASGGG